jgi:hypothetical protein
MDDSIRMSDPLFAAPAEPQAASTMAATEDNKR